MRGWRTVVVWAVAWLAAGGAARADGGDAPLLDPAVQPAQFTAPAGPAQPPPGAVPPGATAPDPPTPVVRLHVHAPSHATPQKDIPYRVTVSNPSNAKAYQVKVRCPLPAGTEVAKAEPQPRNYDPKVPSAVRELVWLIGNMDPGESKVLEVVLRPKPGAAELDFKAFVAFEHGQEVGTKIDRPKLAVQKSAPKQVVAPDPIPVRVMVANTGKVAVNDVKLIEDVTGGFEFTADGNSERGSNAGQRVWNLGTLRPGERKMVEYRLANKGGGELLATTVVNSPDAPDPERAESSTKVLVPGLRVDLTGPPGVQPGEPATYEATVTNTGSMPLTDVRITAAIPQDCKVSRVTNGGQTYRDQVVWAVPDRQGGPLRPGQSFSVRFGLRANTSGQRTVRVTADAGRGIEQTAERSTAFQAAAVLNWRASLDRQTIPAGREGLLTIRVQNNGGDAAKNTRLRVELPAGVKVDEVTPRRYQGAAGEVVFDPVAIPAGGSETYTLTFTATRPGAAWFRLKLYADSLGPDPLTKEQEVQITAAAGNRERDSDRE